MINKYSILVTSIATLLFSTLASAESSNKFYCSTNLRHECDTNKCETLSENVNGGFSFNKKTLLLEACLGSSCHTGKANLHKIDGKSIAVAKIRNKAGHSELLVTLRIFPDNTFIATWTGNEDTRIDSGNCDAK